MADNVTLPATADIIATDDVAGVQFQRVKLTLGGDGVDDGDVSSANPVPVSLNRVGGTALSLGITNPNSSLPTSLPNSVNITGGSISAPVVNTELLTNTVNGWYDAANWRSASIQIQTGSGVSSGVITFEQTNSTGASPAGNLLQSIDLAAINANPVTTLTLAANATRLFAVAVMARYIRVRVSTAVVGGTVQATATGSQLPYAPPSLNVQQAAAANLLMTVAGLPAAVATADALTNPTVTQLSALGMLFNGTNFDRKRGNFNVATGDTGAKTSTVAGITQTNFNARGALITIFMGAVTGSTPTFTAQVQVSPDGGTTWVNVAGAITPTISTTGVYSLTVSPGIAAVANSTVSYTLPRTWRLNFTVSGTTPSFTITSIQVAYMN